MVNGIKQTSFLSFLTKIGFSDKKNAGISRETQRIMRQHDRTERYQDSNLEKIFNHEKSMCPTIKPNQLLPNFCTKNVLFFDTVGVVPYDVRSSFIPQFYMHLFTVKLNENMRLFYQFSDLSGHQIGDFVYSPID